MQSILFTYYSENVADSFVTNIRSVIQNGEKYDALVICSESIISPNIIKQLQGSLKILRLIPFTASRIMKKSSKSSAPWLINPMLLSAFSYSQANEITVVDPNLFVLKQLEFSTGSDGYFFKTHSGFISPSLFKFKYTQCLETAALNTLSKLDFQSEASFAGFSHFIINCACFKSKIIFQKNFIFTRPKETDNFIPEKLIAFDYLNLLTKKHRREFDELVQLSNSKNRTISLSRILEKTGFLASRRIKPPSPSVDAVSNEFETESVTTTTELAATDQASQAKSISIITTSQPNKKFSKMNQLLISYHSDKPGQSYYRNFANALKTKCIELKVDHNIIELNPLGDYSKNCLMKPEFILNQLIENKRALLWMDCDTNFKQPFSEFNNTNEDIGMATHSGNMDGIKASPIFFNYTEGAFNIIREWVIHCNAALSKNITELDHDAIKHYVLPKLSGEFSIKLLSNSWMDFVNGKYLDNGNSEMPEKNEIFRKVNSLSDMERWSISQTVKTFDVKFESIDPSIFENAYQCLLNFSNHSRIRFCFSEKLKNTNSDFLQKLIIESGNKVFFYDFLTQSDPCVKIQVDSLKTVDWKKNWDKNESY